ncbi:hypothetical protein L6R44_06320 [Enterobacter cloacae complex sp. ECC445]|uniref:RCC1 domain-containing protein n=1 Tax=Enterobacter cloacae complex sp. ECC445 TaxID=2913213 RepID=UPI001F4751DC|nr:hypothetical protein [Enterobacter cloacae complex sp. ECC445]MCG0455715.1 hypothetical protein [Enterobacter cloacae complex sp. ECC445]
MAKKLTIMGARTFKASDPVLSYPARIVAFDAETMDPVDATWQYADSSTSVQGKEFLDLYPALLLNVSAEGYDPVIINSNNINFIGQIGVVAIKDDKTVAQWGDVQFTNKYFLDPADNHDVRQVTTSINCAFALRTDGTLRAWGEEQYGGVLPADVYSRTDILRSSGFPYAGLAQGQSAPYFASWGMNSQGQYAIPENIQAMDNIVQVLGSMSRAVLNANGQVFAWGDAEEGGLVPADIAALSDITMLFGNDYSFTALRSNGQLVAWGLAENGGALPDDIVALTDIVRVFPGATNYVAQRANGNLVAWGSDAESIAIPADIAAMTNIVDVKYVSTPFGQSAFVALRDDGTVVSWGSANTGVVPVPEGVDNVAVICVAPEYCLALKKDGTVMGWGSNDVFNDPIVGKLTDVKAIYAEADVAVALKGDNTIVVWGNALHGGSMLEVPDGVQGNISYTVASA